MKITYDSFTWFEDDGKGTVSIGFTKNFIDDVLGECYHITQASMYLVTKGKPMLTIETNNGLKVIRSPLTGTVLNFNVEARDFPDRLTPEDVVVSLRPKGVKVAEEKKAEPVPHYTVQVGTGDLWGPVEQWPFQNNNNNNRGR